MNFCINRKATNFNSIIINNDGSFCYQELREPWDFQVLLDDWRFTLNFDSYTKKCTSCEGVVNESKRITQRNLSIPECSKCGLYIEDFDASRLGIEYQNIKKIMYYDVRNAIFAIGDIETDYQFYEFGIGQYIALDNAKEIVCVIIKFQN